MNNASLNTTRHETIGSAQTLSFSSLDLFGADDTHLCRSNLAGSFSLIDEAPFFIDAVPGMTLHVTSGSIRTSASHGGRTKETPAGHRFVADRCGALMVRGRAGVELQIDWPE